MTNPNQSPVIRIPWVAAILDRLDAIEHRLDHEAAFRASPIASQPNTDDRLVSLHALCREFRIIPKHWLLAEIEAGRVPMLQAGKRRLFNLQAVRAALLQRASRT